MRARVFVRVRVCVYVRVRVHISFSQSSSFLQETVVFYPNANKKKKNSSQKLVGGTAIARSDNETILTLRTRARANGRSSERTTRR